MRAKIPPARFHWWWLAIPMMTAAIQLSIKSLGLALHGQNFSLFWLEQAIGTLWFYAIIILEIASFVLWMHILSTINVSKAVPLTAISYIAILLASWTIFHEPIMVLQIIGSLFILTGIACIGTAPSSSTTDD